MLGEPENQFSLTHAAPSASGRARKVGLPGCELPVGGRDGDDREVSRLFRGSK